MGLQIAFWVLAVGVVASALAVVVLKNVFRAALALVLCLAAVAGIYITLSADFVAAVQVLVYVGGISILILMAIMMTRDIPQGSPANRLRVPALIVAALFLGMMVYTLTSTNWAISSAAPVAPTTAALGNELLGEHGYVLPVEIAAVLILAAMLGAIVMAREK